MTKIKHFLYLLTTMLLASVIFAACTQDPEVTPAEDEPTVKSISLDTTGVKKSFKSGEDAFTSEGLKVTAEWTGKKKATELKDGEYTLSGYEENVKDGKLVITDGSSYQEVTITVTYRGKSKTYTIAISGTPVEVKVDHSDAQTDYFVGDKIDMTGIKVSVLYAKGGEEIPVDSEVVTFTGLSTEKSGSFDVKVSFNGVESEPFTINVYEIDFNEEAEFEKGDAVPSVKVYLGEEEAEAEDVSVTFYDSANNVYENSKFAAGTYTLKVSAGDAVKEFPITVKRPDAENFVVLADETKIEGAALQIRVDASDMNVKWADDLQNVKPTVVSLSGGTVSADPGAFFADPAVNADTGIVEKFTIQIVLTSAINTTVAEVSADIAGTKYKATVRFVDGNCIPSDYVPTGIKLDKPSLELACGASTTFKVTDSKYGLDYSSDVAWSLDDKAETGSTIEKGTFTAGTVTEAATVTVKASLKTAPEVSVTATVTINPEKEDVSSIYGVELFSGDTGAWVKVTATWTDAKYKIVGVSKAKFDSCAVNEIVATNFADDKASFQLNAASAAFRGKSGVISFRAKASDGKYYDVDVAYTETGYNPPSTAGTYEVTAVTVEESVLNPKIKLAKDSIEVQKGGDPVTVAVTYDEILEFDATKLKAVSDNAAVAVSLSGTTLSVTGSAAAENVKVTVTYDEFETVKAELTVSVVEELPPFGVEIITNDGAWCKIKVAYNDEAHKINKDNAVMTNVHMSLDGDSNANVSYAESAENAVVFARSFGAANMTAAVEQTLTFRVETASGEKYDFTVVFTGGKGLTITPKSTEFVAVKEIVLSSEKLTFETLTAQTVTVSQVGITDFDVSSVTVVSDKEDVATAEISDEIITVTPVADGEANVTVTFGDYTKTIAVAVQTSLEEVPLTFKSTSKVEGAGLEIYWENALTEAPSSDSLVISVVFDGGTKYETYEAQITKDDYKPIWCRADGLHFTVPAGFPNGEDFKHSVTITFVQDGKKYSGTCNFEGNAFVN